MTNAPVARWLAPLGQVAIEEVFEAGEIVTFKAGQRLCGELEVGDSLYVILEGSARVTVAAWQSKPRDLGTLSAGDSCGELAALTRELRSATVTAVSQVKALRIERFEFEAILRRYPQIAVHLVHEISSYLADTDRALDEVLGGPSGAYEPAVDLSGRTAAVTPARGSLRRAWRELVVAHRKELPFLALFSFVLTLVAIRLVVHGFESAGADLFVLLRNAYTAGMAILVASVALSFVRFSRSMRQGIAIAYGVGFALIFNELPVFLAFDTFYLDMTTRDPDLIFSVEKLYRRTEGDWAVALSIVFLLQATYLRRFYRRIAFIMATRARALLA